MKMTTDQIQCTGKNRDLSMKIETTIKNVKFDDERTDKIDEIEQIVLNPNDRWSRKNSKEKFNGKHN